ncbi:MAG: hypothetical protein ACOX24_00955 [Christensenellales bacterium]|jgi:nitrogen regulatory protein PII|nr:hypothetical protein [Clostridiales bacterium]
MRALFIIIRETRYTQEILEGLLKLKVRGATMLDSQGMAQAVLGSSDLGSSMGFGNLFSQPDPEDSGYSKTIITVLEQSRIAQVVAEVRNIVGDCEKSGIGFIFSVPVDNVFLLKGKKK